MRLFIFPSMHIQSPTRTAAALFLAYPALLLAGNARAAIQYSWPGYLADRILLCGFLIVIGVSLWRGKRWAYAPALICSGALTAILMLYEIAIWRMFRGETWQSWSLIDHILHFLPFLFLAATFVKLMRDETRVASRRSALMLFAAAVGVELVLIALMAQFGVGGMLGGGTWYQEGLDLAQMPGAMILTQMGMCCGYANHYIVSDFFDSHWGPYTLDGLPVLATANALGILPIVVLARALLRRALRARPGGLTTTS